MILDKKKQQAAKQWINWDITGQFNKTSEMDPHTGQAADIQQVSNQHFFFFETELFW